MTSSCGIGVTQVVLRGTSPASERIYARRGSLTLSLDFKDADGILRVERPDFAGGKRVSPLDTRGH